MQKKQIFSFWVKLLSFLCVLTIAINGVGKLMDGGDDILQSASMLPLLPRNSADVLWMGTSHMHCSMIPQYLYDEYGITSAMATGNAISVDASYWELRQALLTQSPKVVVLDVYAAVAPYCYFYAQNMLGLQYREGMVAGSNPYNTVTGVARWIPISSPFKIPAIYEAWKQSGIGGDAYFPITRMHNRYGELARRDFEYVSNYTRNIRNLGYGYDEMTILDKKYDIEPYSLEGALLVDNGGFFWTFTEEQLAQAQLLEHSKAAIKRIVDFTQKKNIPLVLCAAPYMVNEAEKKLYAQIGELAAEWGVPFVNIEEFGIDSLEYIRDLGHLNYEGSVIFTDFWGQYLSEHYNLPDHRESDDARYAPWRDGEGSHYLQDLSNRLDEYNEGPTTYLEQLMELDEDYLVLITMEGMVYEGFSEDDYWILTEELGAMDETVEEWYYTGTGTLDLVLCGGKLLSVNYEPEGRDYSYTRNVLGYDIIYTYHEGSTGTAVNERSTGYQGEGMNVSVYSRLDHRMTDTQIFDLTQYYFYD